VVDELRKFYRTYSNEFIEPKFIFVTAFPTKTLNNFFKQNGIDDFFEKPVSQKDMETIIQMIS
jgi:FixJ family two-component response regulator